MTMVDVSIVVPVYNGSETIGVLRDQIDAVLSNTNFANSYEVVFVNDRGPVDAWPAICSLAERHPEVVGINLRRNFGQHNATMAGIAHARGEVIVIMDEDLQHPPAAIEALVDAVRRGADVCYTRYHNRQHATWKKWGSSFNDFMAGLLLKKPRGLYLSSFKAIHRDVAKDILRYTGPYPYIDGLLLATTSSIEAIDIDHQPRLAGESSYNLKRLVSLWLKMATGSSVYPLRIATFVGFLVALLSLLALVGVVVSRIANPDLEPGWASVIVTILFVGGVQMVFLGIIGEYVGRIYIRLNRPPQFVVKETTENRRQMSDLTSS
ncbi:glycosyltransferase family 2 protein [Rhizobium sp. BK538]|uniref:glycosyltransferase family 2 protein n=1 Tax=Rhizobium sp. BK538 TaxID=2586984 RepID=UPI00160A3822|nr:glycosyltransferase family 2 protein [Rhizobium sp. BK538]MBB4172083.1 undecaprenyl-phosphate 4-deoxy-4-formamido-L-arabinose transferase [Rhizobium sp. BK538]